MLRIHDLQLHSLKHGKRGQKAGVINCISQNKKYCNVHVSSQTFNSDLMQLDSAVPPNMFHMIARKPCLGSRNHDNMLLLYVQYIQILNEFQIRWLEVTEPKYVTHTYMSRLEITHCICKLTFRPRDMPPCYRTSKTGQPGPISSSRILLINQNSV